MATAKGRMRRLRAHLTGAFTRVGAHIDERARLTVAGTLIGVCSALAAVALTRLLGAGATLLEPHRARWFAFLLPGLGAMLSVLAVRGLFREAGGHGVPQVIYAIARRGGLLRLRSAFSRIVGSALTIASGGSAGPEGPIVISGASIGSNLSTVFGANDRQRRVLVSCGAAGAIAAIFNAPMAGIAFALEAILLEWSAVHLIPIALTSVIATELSRLLNGNQIPFRHPPFASGIGELGASVGLAALCAVAAVALIRALRWMEHTSSRLVASPLLRATLGGIVVGVIAVALPAVSGEGYEIVRRTIVGDLGPGLWLVAAAAAAKLVATSVTLGSGGSGGVFAPCLVIGSLSGAFYHRLLAWLGLPLSTANEGLFALLGMAGLLSGLLQAPLTGILLVVEITGSYSSILPVVLVAVTAASVSHRFEPHSVYHAELIDRGELLRPRTDSLLLADLSITELLVEDYVELRPEMRVDELIEILGRTRQTCFPVIETASRRYLGLIDVDRIRRYLFDPTLRDTVLLDQIMDPSLRPVLPDTDLAAVLERFETDDCRCLPVARGGELIGLIYKNDILESYRKELIVQEHR